MPQIIWRIDDQNLTLIDRARLGVTLRIPGRESLPIPPLTLGSWPFSFADRQFELRSLRNLDRLRYQLWSEGHLLPRGDLDRRRANGERCASHPAEAALCLCTSCRRPLCRACSPNGLHCVSCLDALAIEDRKAALRSRRLGIGLSVAFGLAAWVTGRLTAWRPAMEMGAGVLILVGYLYVRGVWLERKERQQGLPSAVDRQ